MKIYTAGRSTRSMPKTGAAAARQLHEQLQSRRMEVESLQDTIMVIQGTLDALVQQRAKLRQDAADNLNRLINLSTQIRDQLDAEADGIRGSISSIQDTLAELQGYANL